MATLETMRTGFLHQVYNDFSLHLMSWPALDAHVRLLSCLQVLCTNYFSILEPPSAPNNVRLIPQETRTTVRWFSPTDDGGRSDLFYQVEHSDPDNPGLYIGTVYLSGGTTSYTVAGLRSFTDYCIRVTAHNGVSDQDPDGTHLRTVEECIKTLAQRKP